MGLRDISKRDILYFVLDFVFGNRADRQNEIVAWLEAGSETVIPMTYTQTNLSALLGAPSAGQQVAGVVFFAVQWVIACFLATLIIWALLYAFRRDRLTTNRRALFAGIFLVALGVANVFILSRAFVLTHPLLSAPVIVLFFLLLFLFPDKRYTPWWTFWIGIFYLFSMIVAFTPVQQQQNKSNNAIAVALAHIPGVVGVFLILGNMIALVPLMVGIAPQVYFRYRRLPANDARPFTSLSLVALFGALALIAFLLFVISGVLEIPLADVQHPVYLVVRTGYYLVVSLAPIILAFLLMRRRLYDRDALLNRLAIFTPLILALLVIYAFSTILLWFAFPGFRSLLPIEDVPLLILIGLLMAAAFRPLHRLLQRTIDSRFYRRRYLAAQMLASFEATLREERRLDALSGHLTEAVQKAFQPTFGALWLRTTPARSPLGVSSALRTPPATDAAPQAIQLFKHSEAPKNAVGFPTLMLSGDDPARKALSQPSAVLAPGNLQPLHSPLLNELREASAQIVLPLASQGEVVGLVALGARPDGRPYTLDERELLIGAVDQAAPLLRSALVEREQDIETRERERIEQELLTARRIQESLLPKSVPALAGWRIATCYQPAREVGGDFYDFIPLTDGRLGIVLGDVTDKGMPAALVMATTRSMLRAVATQPSATPGNVLAQVNELLCQDLPPSMFVTCFYAILDPLSGHLQFANAGQDLPLARRSSGEVSELEARGMPLGLMSGMAYDEHEATLAAGDLLLFYSDGLVEAHNREREMFGSPRLTELLHERTEDSAPVVFLLQELANFTGPGWEQEDDVTLVALTRTESDEALMQNDRPGADAQPANEEKDEDKDEDEDEDQWQTLDEWELPSEPGAERQAIQRVAEAVRTLNLPIARLEQLKTAVGEATMNAMEHGNNYQADLPVLLRVLASPSVVAVRITDEGGEAPLPASQAPDIEAKLAGLQSPRGWGMFLIEQFVDELSVTTEGGRRTIELLIKR